MYVYPIKYGYAQFKTDVYMPTVNPCAMGYRYTDEGLSHAHTRTHTRTRTHIRTRTRRMTYIHTFIYLQN